MKDKSENLENIKAGEKEASRKMEAKRESYSLQDALKVYSSPRLFMDQNRFTYTFLMDGEVSSIHFDAKRSEIFYKGHNIRNMNLNIRHIQMLKEMTSQIAEAGADSLSQAYQNCLSKVFSA